MISCFIMVNLIPKIHFTNKKPFYAKYLHYLLKIKDMAKIIIFNKFIHCCTTLEKQYFLSFYIYLYVTIYYIYIHI